MKLHLVQSGSAILAIGVLALGVNACAEAEELDSDTLAASHARIDYGGGDGPAQDDNQSAGGEFGVVVNDNGGSPPAPPMDNFPTGGTPDPEPMSSGGAAPDDDMMPPEDMPLADAGVMEPPKGDPPSGMTWETCDPAFATDFCPELACDVTTLCTDGEAKYETDCVEWCTSIMQCVTERKSCITETDPLCISEYFPRDECIDYIDSNSPESAGTSGATNYAGSYGNKAAIALLTCACGG